MRVKSHGRKQQSRAAQGSQVDVTLLKKEKKLAVFTKFASESVILRGERGAEMNEPLKLQTEIITAPKPSTGRGR